MNLPWILLFGGWGAAVALIGGVVGYLWLAADSIEAELKEQRPQVTIKVKPKRRNVERAAPAPREERSAARDAQPAEEGAEGAGSGAEGGNEDLQASLSRLLGKPKGTESERAETAAPEATQSEPLESETGAPAVGAELHPHPDLKLIEETEEGPLPKIDEDGRQPWRVYSRPFNRKDARARIAVVISHLGLSPTQTQDAITKLPSEITLAFAPYARSLDDWVQQARDNGHEVLIGLPMEPSDYPRNDPGPNALMLANSQQENIKRLNWVLSRATGYIGVFNFMGSRFTAEKRSLKPIMQQLKNRGLMILDTRASPFSTLASAAQEVGIPYTAVDIVPDTEPNRGAIDRQLAKVLELAAERKNAVAVVRPLPITMLRLTRWINRLDPEKAVLAPLSAVAGRLKVSPKS